MMVELPLIFLGGLLGSAHCVGMCGGFALTLGFAARGVAENLRRQILYSAGRIFTYSFLGVVAGYAGSYLERRASFWINTQASFSMAAGLLLLAQGLLAMGVVPRPLWSRAATIGPACLMGTFAKPFLTSPHGLHILLAGVFTGFLPCGLVYGYLTLAASASNIRDGLLTMAFFGAGTTPLLILTGTGASLISHAARRRLLRISAACVALTGLISIARGVLFFHFIPAPETVRCLLCGQLR